MSMDVVELLEEMNMLWEQHVYWTRMLLISIAERLKDQDEVAKRLLQNPYDIAAIYADYYAPDVAKTIAKLLTEHLQIGANLITALRDGKTAEAEQLKRQWYMNADKMAEAFSSINPYYQYDDLRRMLYRHLELTTQEVAARLGVERRSTVRSKIRLNSGACPATRHNEIRTAQFAQ